MAIVVKTLSEQAYEIIRERILSNDMQPDKPIRQDALSQTLGAVSYTHLTLPTNREV